MAALLQTLHGSCACGRNRYVVEVPKQQAELAEVRYDNTSASRAVHAASPATVWLRVPLTWYTSATFAQFPDETRASIQRSFISPFAADTRRQFCGYCGTQLTSWHERTRDDADHISLTVGSLLDDDQAALAGLGFLPGGDSTDDDSSAEPPSKRRVLVKTESRGRGAPWFEEMVENTRLGHIKQQRGGHASRDGSVRVEWEVVEWTETDDADDEASTQGGKRKLAEFVQGEGEGEGEGQDAEMRNA